MSNSYGTEFTGSSEDPSETTELDAHFNHPGVAMVAASGDHGYGVLYPASSQYVTAVGGTSLVRDDSARGYSETVWSNFGSSGSGCSAYEPKPAFQKDIGCAKRTVAGPVPDRRRAQRSRHPGAPLRGAARLHRLHRGGRRALAVGDPPTRSPSGPAATARSP